jgi:hypothetical protein
VLLLLHSNEMLHFYIHACYFARFKSSANVIVPDTQRFRLVFPMGATLLLLVAGSQLAVRGCLHTSADVAGVFVIYRWIYVHLHFVSQIFRFVMMGVATFANHLVLISALLSVLFSTGKLLRIYHTRFIVLRHG